MENLSEDVVPGKMKRAARFKQDLLPKDVKRLLVPSRLLSYPIDLVIDTVELLDIRRMGGKDKTHLTLIEPELVQADTANYAKFDVNKSPHRAPIASTRFKPASYGITKAGNYIISFDVETNGTCEFDLAAFAASGTAEKTGKRVVNGRYNLSVVFRNIQPQHIVWVSLEQKSGGSWVLYSSRIRRPFFIFT